MCSTECAEGSFKEDEIILVLCHIWISDLTGQSLDDFLQNELSTLCSTLDDTYNVLSQKWIGTELPAQLSRLSRVHGDKIRHYNGTYCVPKA